MAVKKRKTAQKAVRNSSGGMSTHTYQRLLIYTIVGFLVVLSVAVIMLLQQYK